MIICAEKSLNLQKHPSNFHIFLILISPYFNVKITNQKKTFQGPGKGRPQVWLLKTFKEPVHPSGAPLRDTRRSRERGQLLDFPFSALNASLYLPKEQEGHTWPREQQLSKGGPRFCSLLSTSSSCSSLQLGMNGRGRLLLWGSTAVPLAFRRFMKKHQITQIDPASLSNQVNHKYSPSHYNSAMVRKWRELNESGEKVYCKLLAVCDSLRT